MDYTSLIPSSPIGMIVIKAHDEAVYFIGFDEKESTESPNLVSSAAKQQLEEYFAGTRIIFDFPIQQHGTEFQKKVWIELTKISPGKPISYTALSKRMNSPLAIRAIASANGRNKLMIVVPCHRIIGSSGDLVGYAGGLWRKKWLLEHEARLVNIGQSSLSF